MGSVFVLQCPIRLQSCGIIKASTSSASERWMSIKSEPLTVTRPLLWTMDFFFSRKYRCSVFLLEIMSFKKNKIKKIFFCVCVCRRLRHQSLAAVFTSLATVSLSAPTSSMRLRWSSMYWKVCQMQHYCFFSIISLQPDGAPTKSTQGCFCLCWVPTFTPEQAEWY